MIVYSRYNSQRKPEFRLITVFEKNGPELIVKKIAEDKNSRIFLESFFQKYEDLAKLDLLVTLLKPEKQGNCVVFPYCHKKTFQTVLLDLLSKNLKDDFWKMLKSFKGVLNSFPKITSLPDRYFMEKFGESGVENFESINPSVLDFNFDNIFVSDQKYVLFDYEWTFNFPIPIEFILFRSCYYFFLQNGVLLLKNNIGINDLFDYFEIESDHIELFLKWEHHFQSTINLENKNWSNYLFDYKSLKDASDKKQLSYFKQGEQYILALESENHNLKNSYSYKLGSMILFPFRYIKRLFNK